VLLGVKKESGSGFNQLLLQEANNINEEIVTIDQSGVFIDGFMAKFFVITTKIIN
jgi:hypothetical protein